MTPLEKDLKALAERLSAKIPALADHITTLMGEDAVCLVLIAPKLDGKLYIADTLAASSADKDVAADMLMAITDGMRAGEVGIGEYSPLRKAAN